MTDQDDDPDKATVQEESAIPLPERDAMSIIGGPEKALPVDGPILPHPISPNPPIKFEPPDNI